MVLLADLYAHFWLFFAVAVSVAVLHELKHHPE